MQGIMVMLLLKNVIVQIQLVVMPVVFLVVMQVQKMDLLLQKNVIV
jgi:hypothetical protein